MSASWPPSSSARLTAAATSSFPALRSAARRKCSTSSARSRRRGASKATASSRSMSTARWPTNRRPSSAKTTANALTRKRSTLCAAARTRCSSPACASAKPRRIRSPSTPTRTPRSSFRPPACATPGASATTSSTTSGARNARSCSSDTRRPGRSAAGCSKASTKSSCSARKCRSTPRSRRCPACPATPTTKACCAGCTTLRPGRALCSSTTATTRSAPGLPKSCRAKATPPKRPTTARCMSWRAARCAALTRATPKSSPHREPHPAAETYKSRRAAQAFERLVNMGKRLMVVIEHNRGGANKDLARFASQTRLAVRQVGPLRKGTLCNHFGNACPPRRGRCWQRPAYWRSAWR